MGEMRGNEMEGNVYRGVSCFLIIAQYFCGETMKEDEMSGW
jgi:hypothetical protein